MSLIACRLFVDTLAMNLAMDITEKFGKNVKRLRLKKGLSQEEFAFEAEIHRTYVSDVERGIRNPTITVVERLAKALGVTPGQLLDGTK